MSEREKASVEVEIIPGEKAHVTGRNGTFTPTAVTIWEGFGEAFIEAVGRRNVINGGISLPLEKMDALAMRWLQARGIVMPVADGEVRDDDKKNDNSPKKASSGVYSGGVGV